MRLSSLRGASVALLVAVAAVLLLACGDGDDTPSEPTVVPTATQAVAPTATQTVEEEVREAYLRYWEVYAQALIDLDTAGLADVMTGPRLERALDEVEGLRNDGRAVRVVVENNPLVVEVENDEATVFDEYENSSYLVDPETKEPVDTPPNAETIRDTVTMVRIDGTWKVLDSVREEGSQ